MNLAFILTPWLETGSRRTPLVVNVYGLRDWNDVTEQDARDLPSSPNNVVIAALVSDAQLATIEADTRFVVLSVDPAEVSSGED